MKHLCIQKCIDKLKLDKYELFLKYTEKTRCHIIVVKFHVFVQKLVIFLKRYQPTEGYRPILRPELWRNFQQENRDHYRKSLSCVLIFFPKILHLYAKPRHVPNKVDTAKNIE